MDVSSSASGWTDVINICKVVVCLCTVARKIYPWGVGIMEIYVGEDGFLLPLPNVPLNIQVWEGDVVLVAQTLNDCPQVPYRTFMSSAVTHKVGSVWNDRCAEPRTLRENSNLPRRESRKEGRFLTNPMKDTAFIVTCTARFTSKK